MRDGDVLRVPDVTCRGRVLRVWSRAVVGITVNKPVLRELNGVNRGLVMARVWADSDSVWVEGCLPVEVLRSCDVGALCHEVGSTADRLGSMLAAVHGGTVVFPGGCDSVTQDD